MLQQYGILAYSKVAQPANVPPPFILINVGFFSSLTIAIISQKFPLNTRFYHSPYHHHTLLLILHII